LEDTKLEKRGKIYGQRKTLAYTAGNIKRQRIKLAYRA
jgi:hypothetical protein